jgi:hypothetical protein
MTLAFQRNKIVEVEPLSEGALCVYWRLKDNLMDGEVRLEIRLPDLEIVEAQGRLARMAHPLCAGAPALLQKVVGVRVGPGLRKIVRGLMGGGAGCDELAEGVLDCCNAVILHFTVPQIQATETGSEAERRERFHAMVRFNPRLVRSCVAFADDSPLMQGLDL